MRNYYCNFHLTDTHSLPSIANLLAMLTVCQLPVSIIKLLIADFVLCRYATIYTMFPVFSLVLDQDVKPEMALLYPELYKDLTKVQCLF